MWPPVYVSSRRGEERAEFSGVDRLLGPNRRTMSAYARTKYRVERWNRGEDDDEAEARAAELSVAVEGLATGGQSNG